MSFTSLTKKGHTDPLIYSIHSHVFGRLLCAKWQELKHLQTTSQSNHTNWLSAVTMLASVLSSTNCCILALISLPRGTRLWNIKHGNNTEGMKSTGHGTVRAEQRLGQQLKIWLFFSIWRQKWEYFLTPAQWSGEALQNLCHVFHTWVTVISSSPWMNGVEEQHTGYMLQLSSSSLSSMPVAKENATLKQGNLSGWKWNHLNYKEYL